MTLNTLAVLLKMWGEPPKVPAWMSLLWSDKKQITWGRSYKKQLKILSGLYFIWYVVIGPKFLDQIFNLTAYLKWSYTWNVSYTIRILFLTFRIWLLLEIMFQHNFFFSKSMNSYKILTSGPSWSKSIFSESNHSFLLSCRLCRLKKKAQGEVNATAISNLLPFMEYELHTQLMNKLKLHSMNALFGLHIQISVGENMLLGLAVCILRFCRIL